MAIHKKAGCRSHCPISFGLDIFGDKWSLLIVRDIIFFGKKTYGEFLKSEERIATNVLSSRLELLENSGIIKKSPHHQDKRRDFYTLTPKGLELIPILIEIMNWSERHDRLSYAKRRPDLVKEARANPKRFFKRAIELAKNGGSILLPKDQKS